MTTSAPKQHDATDKLRELDERTRRAWDEYRASLHDLTGSDYERAEDHRWNELQRELSELERERAALCSAPSDAEQQS